MPWALKGLMNKVAAVTRMEDIYGLSNMDFNSPRQTWLQPLLSSQSASSRDQHQISYMGPFHISLVAGWLHWTCFHHGRRSICPYWNTYSGYGFAFPECKASTETTICGLRECFMHVHGYSAASVKGINSIQTKYSNGPTLVEPTGLTMCPSILKQMAW